VLVGILVLSEMLLIVPAILPGLFLNSLPISLAYSVITLLGVLNCLTSTPLLLSTLTLCEQAASVLPNLSAAVAIASPLEDASFTISTSKLSSSSFQICLVIMYKYLSDKISEFKFKGAKNLLGEAHTGG